MAKINRNKLITNVASTLNIPESMSKLVINEFCEQIISHTIDGDEISIKGLLTITPRKYRKKEVQNFRLGERITVSDRVLPSIKISRSIIDECKKNNKDKE